MKGSSEAKSTDETSLMPLREVILWLPSRLHRLSTILRPKTMVELRMSSDRKGTSGKRRVKSEST